MGPQWGASLRGKKRLLEKIGVTARMTKTVAQRAAPAKAATTRVSRSPAKKQTILARGGWSIDLVAFTPRKVLSGVDAGWK